MRTTNTIFSKLVVLFFFAALTTLPVFTQTRQIPLSKGTIWIYEGTIAWLEGTAEKRKNVRLETVILDVFNHPQAQVAVVRSFPSELIWYELQTHPAYSLLILNKKGLYEIDAESESEARETARKFARQSHKLMEKADPVVRFPLSSGKVFNNEIKGFRPIGKLKSYETVFQTLPDHLIIEFVPGLGIVSYNYEHHGTTSSVDVKLKEIRLRNR